MQVLVYLADHPGDVISRQAILDTVWSDVVVGDEVVSRSISTLRKAFDDNPRTPQVIETIPKGGYRLIAPVDYALRGGDSLPEISVSIGDYGRLPDPAPPRNHGYTTVIVAMIIIAGIIAMILLRGNGSSTLESSSIARAIPFTTFQDFEFAPALSPDGKRAAFIWTGGSKRGHLNVYVKLVSGGDPLQLTDSQLYEWSPSWSPDGTQLAFARSLEGIFIIPALGGTERKVADIKRDSRPEIDWSPQGGHIAFTDRDTTGSPHRIQVLTLESGAIEAITHPSDLSYGDRSPVYSPDERYIAFIRVTENASDIYVIPAKGGTPQRLTNDNVNISGLTWSPDGKHILFSSNRGGSYSLWRVDRSGQSLQPVSISGIGDIREPTLRDDVLAYTESFTDVNIWQYSPNESSLSAPLIASTRWDGDPQFSPDGQRIAFASSRSGYPEIWVSDRSGEQAIQLTSFEGPHTGHPRWSPDGKHIVFDTRINGNADIYRIESRGGIPERLTTSESHELLPSISNDGSSFYYTSNRSGKWQIWKKPLSGGIAQQVTQSGGYAALESRDGSVLYYTRRDTVGLWTLPFDTENESLLIESLDASDWGHWGLEEDGLYYLHAEGRPAHIHRYDFASRRSQLYLELDTHPVYNKTGLALDPIGSSILVTRVDQSHFDISVSKIESFR